MPASVLGRCYFVEQEKIAHNIRLLRERVGDRRIYAVLKADGYGLGSAAMARVCAESGLHCFAVSDLKQAVNVSEAVENVEELLLMCAPLPEQIPEFARRNTTFTVSSLEELQKLEPFGARVHIKVDTGLSRRGFSWEDSGEIIRAYRQFPNITFTGIYTHLIDGGNEKLTRMQMQRFGAVCLALNNAGIDPGRRHCCGSSAVFGKEAYLLDGVRIGTAILGRVPGGEQYGLQPTGFCRVPIEWVRAIPKGATVGYGAAFRAKKEMKLALCPIGTHNGFGVTSGTGKETAASLRNRLLRQLHSGITGSGLPGGVIAGRFCPAVGRIFTEAVLLDVTGLDCRPGEDAVFNINPIMRHDMPVQLL